MPLKLSIIVPARNERNRLGPTLDAYLPHFVDRYGDGVEFIVVVNASTDDTEGLARSYADRWPCIRVLVEPGRVGKGGALMIGFRQAGGDLVGFVDADGSTPPEAFDDLVRGIGDAGAIIANRWHPASRISRQPWSRRLASRVFNGVVKLLFRVRITDTQCGAKLMTRKAIGDVMPHLGITQWAFDVDLLFQLRRHGHRIVEIPTTWHDAAGSHLRVGRASFEMLVAVVRLRLIYSPFRWVVTLYDHTLGRLIHHRI
jgi:glycosyltransferase involved in cell wall biosynthesis